jgi:hypothetical protein
MSNVSSTNPIQVDSTGGLLNADVMIGGIMITPSDPTWALIIKDKNGNTIFSANNTGNLGGMPPSVPFKSSGLVVTTVTNCTALIYLVP